MSSQGYNHQIQKSDSVPDLHGSELSNFDFAESKLEINLSLLKRIKEFDFSRPDLQILDQLAQSFSSFESPVMGH